VRPLIVVVPQVLVEHPLKMTPTPGQHPVQALGADGADPSLRGRVRPGSLHGRQQHLGTLGADTSSKLRQNFASRSCSSKAHLAPPLPEPEQQVAGLLGNPGAVRVGGHTAQMDMSGVEFDEEQHVQPSQPDAIDGEETQATIPAACWRRNTRQVLAIRRCWVEPAAAQRRSDCGCRDPNSQALPLSFDALVAPGGVLPGQTDEQLLHLRAQRWPSGRAARVGPGTGDQPPMPAQ
jgi:hypothetical protein